MLDKFYISCSWFFFFFQKTSSLTLLQVRLTLLLASMRKRVRIHIPLGCAQTIWSCAQRTPHHFLATSPCPVLTYTQPQSSTVHVTQVLQTNKPSMFFVLFFYSTNYYLQIDDQPLQRDDERPPPVRSRRGQRPEMQAHLGP